MSRRKQRQIGCLMLLLLVGGFLTLRVWRQLREDLLSAQFLAILKDLHSPEATNDPQNRRNYDKFVEQDKEAEALRLLRDGANPNTRDFATRPHTFWEEMKTLMRRMSEPPSNPAGLPPSALAIAVQANDTVIVTALLKAGANDVNAEIHPNDDDYRFPLVNYAAYRGNLEIVQVLCAHGADIYKRNPKRNAEDSIYAEPWQEILVRPQGEPILQSVLRGGVEDALEHKPGDDARALDRRRRVEIFHLLLAKGAKYEPHSKEGYALLAVAAEGDYLELTRELLDAGVLPNADPDWPGDPPYSTPLDYAVMTEDISLVDLLLHYGASARDTRSEPPILCVRVGNTQMARLLLKHGADLQAGEKRGKREGENVLNFACIAGDTKAILFWIHLGIDANIGYEYFSPIDEAAEYGDYDSVQLLLEHGAKVGPNSPGEKALWLAIAEQHFASAKLLLQYGAAVNPRPGSADSGTYFPLTEAAAQDSPEMALELLKRGANANAGSGEALLTACGSCDEDLVEILLEHGANPNVRSWEGSTAIQIARYSADPPSDADGIVALLKRYGARR